MMRRIRISDRMCQSEMPCHSALQLEKVTHEIEEVSPNEMASVKNSSGEGFWGPF